MESQTADTASMPAFLDRLAGPERAPAGLAAAALSAAMGLALFEKALHHPPEGKAMKWDDLEVIGAIRRKLTALAESDAERLADLSAAMAAPDAAEKEATVKAARLAAYRSSRRIVDYTIQGLTQVQRPLDWGSVGMLADIEVGWRLLAAALEGGIACAEDHLKQLEPAFAGGEWESLDQQIAQGRELADRAHGGLSWRRGKA